MRKTATVLTLLIFTAAAFAITGGTATITTAENGSVGWDFSAGSGTANYSIADLMVEPWDRPGWCGNYVDMGDVAFESVTSAPASGYLWDEQEFEDCEYLDSTHIYVLKTREGKYAKVKITGVQHLNTSEGFENSISFLYLYQDDGSRNLAASGGLPLCPTALIAGLASLLAFARRS